MYTLFLGRNEQWIYNAVSNFSNYSIFEIEYIIEYIIPRIVLTLDSNAYQT